MLTQSQKIFVDLANKKNEVILDNWHKKRSFSMSEERSREFWANMRRSMNNCLADYLHTCIKENSESNIKAYEKYLTAWLGGYQDAVNYVEEALFTERNP